MKMCLISHLSSVHHVDASVLRVHYALALQVVVHLYGSFFVHLVNACWNIVHALELVVVEEISPAGQRPVLEIRVVVGNPEHAVCADAREGVCVEVSRIGNMGFYLLHMFGI